MYQVIVPNAEPKKFDKLQDAFNWMQELVQNGFFDLQLKVVI